MSRALAPEVPPALRSALEPPDLAAGEGFTILLLTGGADGWPHQAMLSIGELIVLDERHLRLALWPGSTTTANLARTGRGTLTAVVGDESLAVRLAATRRGDVVTPSGALAAFDASVEGVSVDVAPYARLVSGVRYALLDPPAVLARWTDVRAALRGAP